MSKANERPNPFKRVKKTAEENVSVTLTEGKESVDLKKGSHVDVPQKTKAHEGGRFVGISKGVTKNLGNFQSLRVDCWLSEEVGENDPKEVARHLLDTIDEIIAEAVDSALE